MHRDPDVDLDLVREELGDLADALIGPTRPGQAFGAYVSLSTDREAGLARFVEHRVFLDAFANDADLLTTEYDRYEPTSVFFVVVDHLRRLPAGMMRLILPSPAGLKSLDDLEPVWGVPAAEALRSVDDDWDLARVWDLATLAVNPEYRGNAALGLVTQGLLQSVNQVALRCGLLRYVTILDVPVLRMLQWKIGRPFSAFPGLEPLPYLGSEASVPMWCDMARWDASLAERDPVLHEIIFAGRGLEPVLTPADWDLAAARIRDALPVLADGAADA